MARKKRINNDFYSELEALWFEAKNHPIVLLRAENALRNPWIGEKIQEKFSAEVSILDIGCGAGFLTRFLSDLGHRVSGIDLSESSLKMAKEKDILGKIEYCVGSGYALPYPDQTFDVVCAMDLLEHVEMPQLVINEASRVLKPGGLFFFHTFNRNVFSYLLVIKGLEWCLKNTPERMHVYPLFLKPQETSLFCEQAGLQIQELKGVAPVINSLGFWRFVLAGYVDDTFRFTFIRSLKTGYCGFARKQYSEGDTSILDS